MDSELLSGAASIAGAVALVFIGGWENARRTRKAEARKAAEADRAALESQANEFVAAVLALRTAGTVHDRLLGGPDAKIRTALIAMMQGGLAAALNMGRGGEPLSAVAVEAWRVFAHWNRANSQSVAGLAAPLSRLGVAVAPLLRREEPELRAAVDAVYTAAMENHDEERMLSALESFQTALSAVLEPPAPARPWWALWRRRRARSE